MSSDFTVNWRYARHQWLAMLYAVIIFRNDWGVVGNHTKRSFILTLSIWNFWLGVSSISAQRRTINCRWCLVLFTMATRWDLILCCSTGNGWSGRTLACDGNEMSMATGIRVYCSSQCLTQCYSVGVDEKAYMIDPNYLKQISDADQELKNISSQILATKAST